VRRLDPLDLGLSPSAEWLHGHHGHGRMPRAAADRRPQQPEAGRRRKAEGGVRSEMRGARCAISWACGAPSREQAASGYYALRDLVVNSQLLSTLCQFALMWAWVLGVGCWQVLGLLPLTARKRARDSGGPTCEGSEGKKTQHPGLRAGAR
jgi:hypothetical protein